MLINRPRTKSDAEQDIEKLIVLVPELVNMTGITEAMKNNFTVMTDIGKVTRLVPEARQEALAIRKAVLYVRGFSLREDATSRFWSEVERPDID